MSHVRAFHEGLLPPVDSEIILYPEESRHLVRVRRVRVGESVEVLDGKGGVAIGVLMNDEAPARIRVDKILRHPAPAPAPLVLAVGLPKGGLLEEIIRQATELGATALQPLLTERAETRHADPDRLAHKQSRWHSAAVEACKQSGNPWRPEILAPVNLQDWLSSLKAKTFASTSSKAVRLVASLEVGAKLLSLSSFVPQSPVLIAIGPEGDFTPAEYAELAAADFASVRLPGHILRVETACAAALSLLAKGTS